MVILMLVCLGVGVVFLVWVVGMVIKGSSVSRVVVG